MMSTKYLIVLCLGTLAVQAKPKLQNPQLNVVIDDVVRDLDDLNRIVTIEQQQAVERLNQELTDQDATGENLIYRLGADMNRELGLLLLQISGIKEKAYELGVDIQECVGNSLDTISDLPNKYMSEIGQCINLAHAEGEQIVDNAINQVVQTVEVIEELHRLVEKCKNSLPYQQEVCAAELDTEINNDRTRIPASIRLALQEALDSLEVERKALLSCGDGQVDRYDQEGTLIVNGILECADNKFPSQ